MQNNDLIYDYLLSKIPNSSAATLVPGYYAILDIESLPNGHGSISKMAKTVWSPDASFAQFLQKDVRMYPLRNEFADGPFIGRYDDLIHKVIHIKDIALIAYKNVNNIPKKSYRVHWEIYGKIVRTSYDDNRLYISSNALEEEYLGHELEFICYEHDENSAIINRDSLENEALLDEYFLMKSNMEINSLSIEQAIGDEIEDTFNYLKHNENGDNY